MEGSPYVDPTLDLFRRTRARSARIGIALQAYLYRTEDDVESLVPLGAAIRLVKGAYLEPPSIAYPKKADVDENFYKLSCRLLGEDARKAGGLLHMATHDPRLVDRLTAFIDQHRVPKSAYEFAMLYGIQRPLQQRLVAGRPPAARADRLRRVLVPVVHAPPGRTSRRTLVRRQERVSVRGHGGLSWTESLAAEEHFACPPSRPLDFLHQLCRFS